MAAQVAAIYLACYQAMWGARVLQSADGCQLLLSAARMRMLLRSQGGRAAGTGAVDAEAAAEAELVKHSTVGGRRRRSHSSVCGMVGTSRSVRPADGPAAKRLKPDPGVESGGSAVTELLQLFQPVEPAQPGPTTAPSSQQAQQAQRGGRKHIVPVPVASGPAEAAATIVSPARKRITPQHIKPVSEAAGVPCGTLQPSIGEQEPQQQQGKGHSLTKRLEGSGSVSGHISERQGCAQQRVVLTNTALMTGANQAAGLRGACTTGCDGAMPLCSGCGKGVGKRGPGGVHGYCAICFAEEQQEAVWAAYIADKEVLLEMLGVSTG
jgi:hypothetical protein